MGYILKVKDEKGEWAEIPSLIGPQGPQGPPGPEGPMPTDLSQLGITASVEELNALVGVEGNVQEQLDGKAPYGLIAVTHVASTDEEILADLDAVIAGMEDGTVKFVRVSGKVGTFLNDRVAVAEVFRAGANYCTVKMSTYTGASGGSVTEYNNGKHNGVWQGWSRNYSTGYKPKLTDLGLTATATELNYMDGVSSNVQEQLNAKTDNKVSQSRSASANWRPLLMHNTVSTDGTDPGSATAGVYYNESIMAKPESGLIKANTFQGALKGNADTATELSGGTTESKISHGETDHWENTLPPFTGIKVNRSRANRFALMPANNILVERSADAGVTWVEDTDFADADKVNLFTNAVANDTLRIMNNLSANERLRITLIAPSNSRTRINQIYTDISTRGHGVRVDIEGALNSAPDTFSILGNNVRLGGWNGPNVINIPTVTWGPSSSSDYGKIRITYKISAVSASQTGKAIVLAIKGYGPYAFYMHSNLAFDDCLYEIGHNGNATFPADITAKTIAGITPTEIGYLSGAERNIQNQINMLSSGLPADTEVLTVSEIRAICK